MSVGRTKRKLVYVIFNGTCFYCGRQIEFNEPNVMEIDHAWPKARGGVDNLNNLALSCKDCNSKKCDATLREFAGVKKELEFNKIHNRYKSLREEKRQVKESRDEARKRKPKAGWIEEKMIPKKLANGTIEFYGPYLYRYRWNPQRGTKEFVEYLGRKPSGKQLELEL